MDNLRKHLKEHSGDITNKCDHGGEKSKMCKLCGFIYIWTDAFKTPLKFQIENNPCRKDVTSVKRHIPEESLTNVTSVTVTQLGTTACGVYTAHESLSVPSFS